MTTVTAPDNESDFVKAMVAVTDVFADAKEKGLKKGNGGQSSVACSACGTGTINYSVANVNGHIFAKCTSAGCVKFMQ